MPKIVPSQVVDLIDQTFPAARDQPDNQQKRFSIDKTYSVTLAGIIALVDQIPAELLFFTRDKLAIYTCSVAAIKLALEEWKTRNYGLERIPGYGNKNPVSLLRETLSECPDEILIQDQERLDFIEDSDLRKNLSEDIGFINNALVNGEWKATTVLAGATIEALLLWSLKRHDIVDINQKVQQLLQSKQLQNNPGSNLEDWSLHPLIEVALKLGLIHKDTARQSKLAKDFRNLIHPGREKRLQQSCNRGTALSAVAAIEFIINDHKQK
jgi:hypothetical protein